MDEFAVLPDPDDPRLTRAVLPIAPLVAVLTIVLIVASIIGADELSARDRRYLEFADAFEQRFVQQGEDEDRSIEETLNLAWDLLSTFPPQALTRVNETEIAKYHRQSA